MSHVDASGIFDERDRTAINAKTEAADNATDQGRWNGVHRIVRADGSVRWVSIHGRRYYRDTPHGKTAVRSVGTVIDITHLKEAEAALRESELRLRLALGAAQMGTFEVDIAGTEALIDAQQAKLIGLPEDTRTVSINDLRARIPLEDLQASDAKKEIMERGLEAYRHEFRLLMPDGRQRWFSAHAAIKANRIFGVNFDITDRKQAEEALRESEARLRIAASGAALGVFEWRIREDATIWENDRIYEIFGHTRGDAAPSRKEFVERYLHPDDLGPFEEALQQAQRTGTFHVVCRIRQKTGHLRWVQFDGKLDKDETGEPTRLIGVAADITARITLEHNTKELTERIITLQEEERQRIAQELHDSTAQHLVAASLTLMGLRPKTGMTGDEERLWDDVEASMGEALKELRTFTYLLYPAALRADGLRVTLQQYTEGYANRSGLAVKLRLSTKVDNLPFRTQQSLFRVFQEILTNVYRHASASRVWIHLRWISGRLHLVITDDGRGVAGIAGSDGRFRPGLGIRGIKARVDQLGGDLRIRTGTFGTTVHAVVPVS
jgi:PAS domain S-box-containing protein